MVQLFFASLFCRDESDILDTRRRGKYIGPQREPPDCTAENFLTQRNVDHSKEQLSAIQYAFMQLGKIFWGKLCRTAKQGGERFAAMARK
jgi:hypothetical protein